MWEQHEELEQEESVTESAKGEGDAKPARPGLRRIKNTFRKPKPKR